MRGTCIKIYIYFFFGIFWFIVIALFSPVKFLLASLEAMAAKSFKSFFNACLKTIQRWKNKNSIRSVIQVLITLFTNGWFLFTKKWFLQVAHSEILVLYLKLKKFLPIFRLFLDILTSPDLSTFFLVLAVLSMKYA